MKRKAITDIRDHLNRKQITLIIGARQTGKTTLIKQLKSDLDKQRDLNFFLTMENPDHLNLLNQHPEKLFQIIPPISDEKRMIVFIDEVQYLNNPSNFLKYHYDMYQEKIKFIVSGSSSFYIDEKFKDSMAGRKRIFTMPTLDFEEFLIFKKKDELVPYLNSGNIPGIYKDQMMTLLYEYIIYGGYPEVVLENDIIEKKKILKEIAESYVKKDAIESSIKHPDIYIKLMKILSMQVGNLLNYNNLSNDLNITNKTLESYTHLMKKSFHLFTINPFFNNVSKELRKQPKLYFADLGLRNYFCNNFDPIGLREDRGMLFENFAFRRFLDKYSIDEINYWRTQKKQEVDFIIDGKYAWEAKCSEDLFNVKRYKYFHTNYPDIPLKLIHLDNAMEVKL